MKTSPSSMLRRLSTGLLAFACTFSVYAADLYRPLKEIPLGGDGGWDYLTIDAKAHRLYVSHATKLVVLDTGTDAVVGEIADTPGVHGFAIAPKLGLGFSSNGKENKMSVVELSTLKTLSKIPTHANPDAILYEPSQNEIYTFSGRDQNAFVASAGTGKPVATIPLGGKSEFAQLDKKAGLIYNNLEDKNEMVVIAVKTHAVVKRWPLAPGEEPTGLAFDAPHHRLFVGCGNARLLVVNSETGVIVTDVPAGAGIDAVSFDTEKQLVFTSNGEDGTVTIIHEDSPDKFSIVQTLATEKGARTMALDPVSHKIYLASAKFEAPSAEGKRPKIINGSFKLLVYGLGTP